jgi:hypothetical protein
MSGGSASGYLVSQVINSVIPNWFIPLFSAADVYDATNNPSGNLLPNGLLTGTSTSGLGGCTGNIATSTTQAENAAGMGSATCVLSVSTTADNRPVQVVTLSGTYSGTSKNVFLFQDVATPSNVNVGDVLEGKACINIGSNTNIAGVNVRLLTTESGTSYFYDAAQNTALAMPSAGWASGSTSYVCMWTPRRTVTAVPTKVELDVYINFVTQGSSSSIAATVNVQSMSVRKVVN